jgi:hypothetical protein
MKYPVYATAVLAMLLASPRALCSERYSYSADGSEVNDATTGLVWRRCAEGMRYSGGTCTGTYSNFTHEQALSHAQTQSASGWRLPNVKELASIADRTRSNPAIDTIAFPATPSWGFWTSTPYFYVASSSYAWYVYFYVGNVAYDGRGSDLAVRLVR